MTNGRKRRPKSPEREANLTLRQERQVEAVKQGTIEAVKELIKDPEVMEVVATLLLVPDANTLQAARERASLLVVGVLGLSHSDDKDVDDSDEIPDD